MISSKTLGSLNFPVNIHVSKFSVSRQDLPRRFKERTSAQLLDETIDLRTCRVAYGFTEWRQTKAAYYQKYVAALSSIVSGRSTPAAQERYADAVNALTLIASPWVLDAVQAFQREISYRNTARNDERRDALLNAAINAMRKDIQPKRTHAPIQEIQMLAPPPIIGTPVGKS